MSDKSRNASKAGRKSEVEAMPSSPLFMWTMLRGFIWLDRCLQDNLAPMGWPTLSRTESQIMLLASAGITRQVEISKALGLTRQAINQSLGLLKERGLIDIHPDPADGRCKIITFAEEGRQMRQDALRVIEQMENELADRIGRKTLTSLRDGLERNWGEVPIFRD